MQEDIKIVGSNGQICIGKKFARKQVLVVYGDENTILLKFGEFLPKNTNLTKDIIAKEAQKLKSLEQ